MKVCGIDEVGRGPLAGPVTAAAVLFTASVDPSVLGDSKKLTLRQRERAAAVIDAAAIWALGWASPAEIDRINILHASMVAMRRAWFNLAALTPLHGRLLPGSRVPGTGVPATGVPGLDRPGAEPPTDLITLVDGNRCPDLPVPCRAVVRGDATVPEIMAASILAKLARDRWIDAYAATDPRYGFETHKGYPTAAHKAQLSALGPSPIHRRSFRGVLRE